MRRPTTALVIGGGIAGPVAAAALQKAGIDPIVYEAHENTAEGVGAFLGLSLNGIDALRAVGMDQPVVTRGFATPRFVITNGNGRVLADFPNGGRRPDGTGAITISRPDLYAALRQEATRRGIPIEHGKRLVDAETSADGVRARFTDGTTAEADLLVGADGIRSTVRRLLDPDAPDPTYVGFLNTGGYARGVDVPGDPGVNYLVFGKRSTKAAIPSLCARCWQWRIIPTRPSTSSACMPPGTRSLIFWFKTAGNPGIFNS